MSQVRIHRCESPTSLAHSAAIACIDLLQRRTQTTPSFRVTLLGGRIAQPFYSHLVAAARTTPTLFDQVHLFWGDERCVPPTDPESNFLIAQQHLITPLRIPDSQVHRISGELPPTQAAANATNDLQSSGPNSPAGTPILDLVLLGMGEDGHVASLFPPVPPHSTPDPAPNYVPVIASKPPPNRITLSYQVLIAARQVWVLASGKGKEPALKLSLAGATTPLGYLLGKRNEAWAGQEATTTIYTDIPAN